MSESLCAIDGNIIGIATVENSKEISQKTNSRTTIWSTRFILGYLIKENKNTN